MPSKTRQQTLHDQAHHHMDPLQAAAALGARTNFHRPPSATKRPSRNAPIEPPHFTIDLSLPPEQRYSEVCNAFRHEMLSLASLFDEVVGGIFRILPIAILHFCCRVLLRKVYNREENAELRGISRATGVHMYLLVCFNVLLDLFMGCSSGGARVADKDTSNTKMVHFRTLDWGMDSLRLVVVQLDFKMGPDQPVFASSITYAGFVGVLTGARRGLSISLNFRPLHDNSQQYTSNLRYYGHHVMVLLGLRPSISSTLRTFLLRPRKVVNQTPDREFAQRDKLYTYEDAISQVARTPRSGTLAPKVLTTTACYLCFCNGKETTIVEKDRITSRTKASEVFIVVTNADFTDGAQEIAKNAAAVSESNSPYAAALVELTEEALDRKECAEGNWECMQADRPPASGPPSLSDVVELVQKYPTTNECTHFACVMDPARDRDWICWCRIWREPIGDRWIRDHKSS